jgi:hypothetical protein
MSFLESDRRGWNIFLPVLLRIVSACLASIALVAIYATRRNLMAAHPHLANGPEGQHMG